MIKKIICCFSFLFIFTGCKSDLENHIEPVIVTDEITCTADDNKFNLILENGQIVKYIDSVDGVLGQEIVDILNDEHLVGVVDNDEALKIMDSALKDLDGYCEKVYTEE